MYVLGIGNVVECNRLYIHLNNEGKQDRIKATEEKLREIQAKAAESVPFYERMYQELKDLHERRRDAVEEKYHFITDDDIKAAYEESNKAGFDLSIRKDSNNEECIRQISSVYGIYEGARYALERKNAIYKIMKQAENAIRELR